MSLQPSSRWKWLVVVAALGYFVDIYDLILFNVIKNQSLTDLGFVPGSPLFQQAEVTLFNWQMGGMLLGGLLWGILGDRKGRAQALFGSILMYSIANLANAFATDLFTYQLCRLVAGIGLAGELGAGITLVAESMPTEKRGLGTVVIVSFGTLGAVAAFLIGKSLGWQGAFIAGGIMGLALLLVRMRSFETGLFHAMAQKSPERGNFFLLFARKDRALRYVASIAIGLPIWFTVGIPIALTARFAKANQVEGVIVAQAVMLAYIGISVGDLISGALSQWWKSRKKVILAYLLFLTSIVGIFLSGQQISATTYYALVFAMGVGVGYWALFVTIASENFGTNLRSTVTNTVPNFVRGAVVPMTLAFTALSPAWGVVSASMWVGIPALGIALLSLAYLPESFHKDLDYLEETR